LGKKSFLFKKEKEREKQKLEIEILAFDMGHKKGVDIKEGKKGNLDWSRATMILRREGGEGRKP